MSSTIAVEYELLPQDLIEFYRYHRRNSSAHRQYWLKAIFLPAIAFGILGYWFYFRGGGNVPQNFQELLQRVAPIALIALGTFSLLALKYWLAIRKATQRMLEDSRRQGIIGKQRTTISSAGISTWCETSEATIKWPAVLKIVSSQFHIFIYINERNGIVIPRRAFESDFSFEKFLQASVSYQQAGAGDIK